MNEASPSLLAALSRAKIVASDGAALDYFGISVAVDGDTAVVGAFGDSTPAGQDAGSAYVFVRSGTTWTQQAKLTASDGNTTDNFGSSVAVDGDTAVVGADQDDTSAGEDAGSAYVFVRSGTVWTPQAKLTASDGGIADHLGNSVALDGDTALVGASADDTLVAPEVGSAYVFFRSGTVWTQQAKLTASDGSDFDFFGNSVALDGDTAVVGAQGDDTPAETDAGSAYVFVRSGTTWTEQDNLTASDGVSGDHLGYSVAVSGETAVIGAAFGDTPAGFDAGSAYVFVRSGTNWTEQAKLTAPDGAPNDVFGWAVALSGDIAVVSAIGDNTPRGRDAGSAYAFIRSGTTWAYRAKLTDPNGAANDHFGWSVALEGTAAAVGAPEDDTAAGSNAGSATMYSA
jgi:hypothetical protein